MAEKITKQEAVRRALKELGNDAKPARMKGWIKDNLGIDMTADHISTAKGTILRAGRKGKPAAGKKPGPRKAEAAPRAATSPVRAAAGGKEAGIPLDDILYVKQLVGRFGPGQLHTLVDAFAR